MYSIKQRTRARSKFADINDCLTSLADRVKVFCWMQSGLYDVALFVLSTSVRQIGELKDPVQSTRDTLNDTLKDAYMPRPSMHRRDSAAVSFWLQTTIGLCCMLIVPRTYVPAYHISGLTLTHVVSSRQEP